MSAGPRLRPSPFAVVRTTLLPFDEYRRWTGDLRLASAGDDPGELAAAAAADRARLRAGLGELIARPEVREALFLASPDLEEGLGAWRRDPDGAKGRRAEEALVRYLLRMVARATPFGLFSGCATARLGESTRLRLGGRGGWRRRSRLDMDYLARLCEELARAPEIRRHLRFHPNPSLYRAGGRLRYAEERTGAGGRSYHLVAVESHDFLDRTLERAAAGARLDELAAALLADDPEIEREEAAAFLDELVETRLLLPELAPSVTGGEPVDELAARLEEIPPARGAARALAAARRRLEALDRDGLGQPPERYRELAAGLAETGTAPELGRMVQVDAVRAADGADGERDELVIGQAVIDELMRGLAMLRRLASGHVGDPLEPFRTAFGSRYEEGTEVPLLEALDEELGVGFQRAEGAGAEASPLLAGIAWPPRQPPQAPWGVREAFLLQKLHAALAEGAGGTPEIELEDAEVAALPDDAPPLADAFHVMAELMADSPERLEGGEFEIFLHGGGGPSGARLLGRFCDADPALCAGVEEHLRAEEACDPDALYAEVVHLPEGRIGNVLRRPLLRGWEIPFLGRSGAPPERQLPVSDLTVTVVGRRVVLRSQSLGRRVVPRLTSAHNFGLGQLGVYRFLGALQSSGRLPGLGFRWGALDAAPYLPRVRSGRLILARARWRVDGRELRPLVSGGDGERLLALRRWRRRRRLPRLVVLTDADNELLVDLDNPLAIDAFLGLARRREALVLTELLPPPDKLCAAGAEGRYVHELLVPFVSTPEERPPRRPRPAPPAGEVESVFVPGSTWLYAKLYTGSSTADRVLREVVAPLRRRLLDEGIARRWFFLRFGDPEWHLRLRFEGEAERLLGAGLARLREAAGPALAGGEVWRLQLDTYRREVARFGGPEGIALAEELFEADSEAVLAIAEGLDGDAGADARWRLALLGVDALLGDFGLDLDARLELAERMADTFAAEHRIERRGLSDRLRREQRALDALLGDREAVPELAFGAAALGRRSTALAPIAAELARRARAGRLSMEVDEMVPTFAHLFVNRLARSAGREHEVVIYDFLARLYRSRLARARAANARRERAG